MCIYSIVLNYCEITHYKFNLFICFNIYHNSFLQIKTKIVKINFIFLWYNKIIAKRKLLLQS